MIGIQEMFVTVNVNSSKLSLISGQNPTQIKINDADKKDFFKEKSSLTGGYKYFPVIFNMDVFIKSHY